MANFRDLAGIALTRGVVRPGRLLRSAAPAHYDRETLARLAAFGPVTIVDLRSAAERACGVQPALPGSTIIAPHGDSDSSSGDPAGLVAACTVSPAATRAAIAQLYVAMPDTQETAFAAVFKALSVGFTPLLVHCAVGKDRTGAAIAILLAALGASRKVIVADYLASNASRAIIAAAFASDPRTAAIRAAPAAVWEPMLTADSAWLTGLLDRVTERHGSARAYVERAVDAGGLERLADHLVRP